MTATAFIVLAAGEGTRMKSDRPKVLHTLGGRTIIGHIMAAVAALAPERACVVVAPDMDSVAEAAATTFPGVETAVQRERLGTGHAVMMARDALKDFDGTVVVLLGDVPLVRPETISELAATVAGDTAIGVLGFEAADPFGYGRLVLDNAGDLVAIREQRDATSRERQITLCNSGAMAFRSGVLWGLLDGLGNDNAQGEYYLTDLIGLAVADGHRIAHAVCDESEVMGINDRVQLATAEAVLQARYRRRAMLNGATLTAPETVFLAHDTEIGRDVMIGPNVVCATGVKIGDGATVHGFCHFDRSEIGENCEVGPFARLRPGSRLMAGSKVGNFVEMKNTTLGPGSKASHLSYVGDTDVGTAANIGAGTITCNYDGFQKHRTVIGDGAFIGSNSALVAPITIGAGAYVGSGSVITKDVDEGALAVARGRQENKPGWAERFKAAKTKTPKD